MLGPTGHSDTFARDNLPHFADWPKIDLEGLTIPTG